MTTCHELPPSSLTPVAKVDHMSSSSGNALSLDSSQHILLELITSEYNKAYHEPPGRLSNATRMHSIHGAS